MSVRVVAKILTRVFDLSTTCLSARSNPNRKLLNKGAQDALGISSTFLGSIAVEVCQPGFGCWIGKEPVNDL